MLKVLIAGSRTIRDKEFIEKAILSFPYYQKDKGTYFLSGGAAGVDTIGIDFIKKSTTHYEVILPEWEAYGKKAGMLRNKVLVSLCDCAIIIWDGVSRGTKNTLSLLFKEKKPFVLYYYKKSVGEKND
jgi:hypothetical protein